MEIAILVPICSRNQNYTSINDIPFIKQLYHSFVNTKDDNYKYTFFIGFDDDDEFYIENYEKLKHITTHIHKLYGCQSAPATAWNKLANIAYNSNVKFDYFFQIGDDVKLLKPGWTKRFISKLIENDNIGVVGPCNLENYYQRVNNGHPYVIENSFVHRKHLDIFGYFFYPSIKNWYCDNWITEIYKPYFSEIQVDMECCNSIYDSRYKIEAVPLINTYINEGKDEIHKFLNKKVFSYCLYGSQKKYCLGMIKNIEQITELYPDFKIYIHTGSDVPIEYIDKYNSYKNVKVIKYNFTGHILMIYRFFSIDDKDVAISFSRDSDSRFGERDIWCINNFLQSNYKIFTIRDHYHHDWPLMGGQWGLKKIDGLNIQKCYELFIQDKDINNGGWHYIDQEFIRDYIYQQYINNFVAYGRSIPNGIENVIKIEPNRRNEQDFCGNIVLFDDNNKEYYEFNLPL